MENFPVTLAGRKAFHERHKKLLNNIIVNCHYVAVAIIHEVPLSTRCVHSGIISEISCHFTMQIRYYDAKISLLCISF